VTGTLKCFNIKDSPIKVKVQVKTLHLYSTTNGNCSCCSAVRHRQSWRATYNL